MENKKVKDLKLIAKQYDLHGYSKLRKAELIHVINEHERKQESTRKVNSSSNLDEAVSEINIPFLNLCLQGKAFHHLAAWLAEFQNKTKEKLTNSLAA